MEDLQDSSILEWLLEDGNPAVKYRTMREILDQKSDKTQVKQWIFSKIPVEWYQLKGLWYNFYITAFAECGLSREDIPEEHMKKAIEYIKNDFEYSCSDFMLLTSLIKLGYYENLEGNNIIEELEKEALPDGGFLCKRRAKKLNYVSKSCYKADLHVLLFLAECIKKNIKVNGTDQLVNYFFSRNIFYKSDLSSLVLDERVGWRSIDIFYPYEPMRVGLHNIVEAFSAMGYGNSNQLNEAWQILNRYVDDSGKLVLAGTITKSYLPKEKVGRPNKWATFYMLLAEKERNLY